MIGVFAPPSIAKCPKCQRDGFLVAHRWRLCHPREWHQKCFVLLFEALLEGFTRSNKFSMIGVRDSHCVIRTKAQHSFQVGWNVTRSHVITPETTSPALNSLSIGFKQETGQRFCKEVCILQFRVTFLCFQPAFRVLFGMAKGPEVM